MDTYDPSQCVTSHCYHSYVVTKEYGKGIIVMSKEGYPYYCFESKTIFVTGPLKTLNLTLHCNDGPAVRHYKGEYSFTEWHVNGKLHRIGGPAKEIFDMKRPVSYEYWVDGDFFFVDEYRKLLKKVDKLSTPLKLTDECWWVREMGLKEFKTT